MKNKTLFTKGNKPYASLPSKFLVFKKIWLISHTMTICYSKGMSKPPKRPPAKQISEVIW